MLGIVWLRPFIAAQTNDLNYHANKCSKLCRAKNGIQVRDKNWNKQRVKFN
jgi:hypothetical protein